MHLCLSSPTFCPVAHLHDKTPQSGVPSRLSCEERAGLLICGHKLLFGSLLWLPNCISLTITSQNSIDMTNEIRDSSSRRRRRYSVTRLLELAPRAVTASFDLSKFTYDAARGNPSPDLVITKDANCCSWCSASTGCLRHVGPSYCERPASQLVS